MFHRASSMIRLGDENYFTDSPQRGNVRYENGCPPAVPRKDAEKVRLSLACSSEEGNSTLFHTRPESYSSASSTARHQGRRPLTGMADRQSTSTS